MQMPRSSHEIDREVLAMGMENATPESGEKCVGPDGIRHQPAGLARTISPAQTARPYAHFNHPNQIGTALSVTPLCRRTFDGAI